MSGKRVAILVETSLDSGRQIVNGIARYAHERHGWSIFYHTGPLGAMVPASLENWTGDGIIARIANPQIEEIVSRRNVPVVDVIGNLPNARHPIVKSDNDAISRLVGKHFLDRGYRHLAFFGLSREAWSAQRRESLARFCQENLKKPLLRFEFGHSDRETWGAYFEKLQQWILSLPKPIGIMVGSDQFAPDLLAACHQIGVTSPDQVSVVGVDNDEPFCEICQPRLSSVEPGHDSVGYEAAKLLDRFMQNGSPDSQLIQIPPRILHVRESSDATALEDPALVKALRYIRANAAEHIAVDEIARQAGVSRSVLQRRFRSTLKKTVLEAILTVRLNRAKEMLTITDLPLPDIAERCGFKHQEYLGYVFKKHVGCTPGQFRARTPK